LFYQGSGKITSDGNLYIYQNTYTNNKPVVLNLVNMRSYFFCLRKSAIKIRVALNPIMLNQFRNHRVIYYADRPEARQQVINNMRLYGTPYHNRREQYDEDLDDDDDDDDDASTD